tara:strand:+ start:2755 stop:3540 length:786 start_codon:yes stop_codon:yes gene_type:complete
MKKTFNKMIEFIRDKYQIILILFLCLSIFIYLYDPEKYIEYNLYNGEKWGPKETSEAYRFGDIFTGYIYDNKNNDNNPNYLRDIEKNYPNSFGSKYVKYSGYPKTYKKNDFDILSKIFSECKYETPDDETLVVHLRLGDILNKSISHYSDYYHDESFYHKLLQKVKLNKNIKKVDIITGLHKNVYIKESNDRLNKIRNIFAKHYPVNVIITNDPDKDLYYMCHSKYFVKSGKRGEFTGIISEYIKYFNSIQPHNHNHHIIY